MISKSEVKDIIFILPFLNVNTTSTARFISFIDAFSRLPSYKTHVVIIHYPSSKSYSPTMQIENANIFINAEVQQIAFHPPLNYIQKIGFYFLEKGNTKLWKVAHLLHLLFFRADLYQPDLSSLKFDKGLSKNGYIFSSGGPFSYHDAAAKLANKLNYKLLLDYRDPWTFGYQLLGNYSIIQAIKNNLQRKKEVQLLKKAHIITTVSETLKRYFPKEYHQKLTVIANGSNYEDTEIDSQTKPNTFDVAYLGTIYHEQLQDESFFTAFQSFIQNKDLTKINLYFLGSHLNPALKIALHKYGLHQITTITKRLSKREILPYLNKASIFLHLKYGERNGIITSKQADYLAFRKPILLPITDYGDLEKSILDNNAGFVGNTKKDILKFLETRWEIFLKGESPIIHSKVNFETLSRKAQAEKFVGLLTRHLDARRDLQPKSTEQS